LTELFKIIAEDDDFLVINKPAGLVCHPTKGDVYSSLISRVRLYLKTAETPHMINRLDRETSGIVLIGKRLESTVKLRTQWENRAVEKEYMAIVHGHFPRTSMSIRAPLGKDTASQVAIKDTVTAGGSHAETFVTLAKRFQRNESSFSLLRIVPTTGRKHQIRIHLSWAGYPIVGDKLYGGDENLYLAFATAGLTAEQRVQLITEHHALHASLVRFEWDGATRTFSCAPENWFCEFAGL
jgi:23S rRNA pseudouridine1911/1915/1917 synthase